MLTRRGWIRKLDAAAIEAAIRAAEKRSSAEIVVSVAPLFWGNVRRTAERAFARLSVDRTAHRNGVLIFVVPGRRTFVVLGDEGIHAKVGDDFWREVAAAIEQHFRGGDFTAGLVAGVALVGEKLAEHFPSAGDADVNELPDSVDFT